MDAVQAANSGHPGLPMGMAPGRLPALRAGHAPRPAGPAAGPTATASCSRRATARCCSTRRCTSRATTCRSTSSSASASGGRSRPGHPERDRVHVTPGVEITTGPLGQGFANGVGMAIAERFLRERYGAEVMDHRVFAICSDGDLMEGVASEAASLAGHLGLGPARLPLRRQLDLARRADALSFVLRGRPRALPRLRLAHPDGRRRQRPRRARGARSPRACRGRAPDARSRVRSIIGWPAPTSRAPRRRTARRWARTRCAPRRRSWAGTPTRTSSSPTASTSTSARSSAARRAQREWQRALRRLARGRTPSWRRSGTRLGSPAEPLPGLADALPRLRRHREGRHPQRGRQGDGGDGAVYVPTMVGGAADLSESTKTAVPGRARDSTAARLTRNIRFGVREHGDGRAP